MKHTLLKLCLVQLLAIFMLGCSSTKLSRSWQKEAYNYEASDHLLIYARSEELDIRKRYESKMVEELAKAGMAVKATHIAFADITTNEDATEEENRALATKLLDNNIDRAFVMFLKDTKVNYITRDQTEGSSQSIPRRSGFSFTDSYNVNSVEYLSQGPNKRGPDSKNGIPDYQKFNTYIIEGILYDLKQPYKEQLVASFEIEVDEPATADEILDQVIGIFSKELKKLSK